MRVSDPVSSILRKKGSEIWSLPSDATVYSAVEIMAEKHVGALFVIDDVRLVGIISERDYARKVILMGRASKDTLVSEIMTTSLVTIAPECAVDDAMRIMETNRVRHAPVVKDGSLHGMITLGDLVKWILSTQDHTIEQLEHYITSQYPG